MTNGISGDVYSFGESVFQSGAQEESATRISGTAFNLFLRFVLRFVRTENPNSHMYVVVKGMRNKTLV